MLLGILGKSFLGSGLAYIEVTWWGDGGIALWFLILSHPLIIPKLQKVLSKSNWMVPIDEII